MSITDLARADFNNFVSADAGEVVYICPTFDGVYTELKALSTKHHLTIDEQGAAVNSKNTHCCFSEQMLVDAGYTVRNADDEIDLIDHFVKKTDSSGVPTTFIITETMPSETFGQIVCFLSDYE